MLIGLVISGPAPVIDKNGIERPMMDIVNENRAILKQMREDGKEYTKEYNNLMTETLLILRDTPDIEIPVWPHA